ncbi:hypothetical protein KAFR_0D02450 [Kazachstania africana CBS 2517]|uniref:Uncharacterized protein n=1 Tax=Kazachstania africana (strain ATCC 22294 / BCRC 22015 / CBS 2517 / CECT 1963 / NBRC 1671 / NRRL Y-8276) TaxID=1071382 RepID=H2AU42_KAZAF|nr:hypothetical protein KAFR_0D02450 [Kazachstania africana CBS 2517]CCF57892.1 hypothetical protein KAFR_0D02450 [Kazachstania africana CBS 2517]
MEKPQPRKRGRPPITKNYTNPLESPMAISSMQVQKQGTASFSKPLMKVGQLTPTPKKRRQNSVTGGNISFTDNSPLASSPLSFNSAYQPNSITKKGRYRGIILSTPVKQRSTSSSSLTHLSTPTSNDHPLGFKANVRSSPPVAPITPFTENLQSREHRLRKNSPLNNNVDDPSQMMSEVPSEETRKFSLSLSIDGGGKATIGSLSSQGQLRTQSVVRNPDTYDNTSADIIERKHVLNLLKKMKNNSHINKLKRSCNFKKFSLSSNSLSSMNGDNAVNAPSISSPTFLVSTDTELKIEEKEHRKPLILPSTPPPPPPSSSSQVINSSAIFKPGTSPASRLDQLLLDSNVSLSPASFSRPVTKSPHIPSKKGYNGQTTTPKRLLISPKAKTNIANTPKTKNTSGEHIVFKFSSGDPVLLTDDNYLGDQQWQDNGTNILPSTSPNRQMCFNTPPSFLNLGSPGASLFSPFTQRRNSGVLIPNNTNVVTSVAEPETPKYVNISLPISSSLGLTPFVNIWASPHTQLTKDILRLNGSAINETIAVQQGTKNNDDSASSPRAKIDKNKFNDENSNEQLDPIIQSFEGEQSKNIPLNANNDILQDNHNTNEGDSSKGKLDDARIALKSLITER